MPGHEDRYKFLLELAQNKALCFPSLEDVSLMEGDAAEFRRGNEGRLPKDLSDTYTAAEIKLLVLW